MPDNLDSLLKSLNEVTCETNYLINSSPDKILNEDINDHFDKFKKSFLKSINKSVYSLSDDTLELIDKVKTIPITDKYRIVTYPNIHNDKKFDVKANVLIDYVSDRIHYYMEHPDEDFNSDKINEEGIAYTLKTLIGDTPRDKISLSEFKHEYMKYALGDFIKVQMIPKIPTLIILAKRTALVINYMNTHYIFRHMNMLNTYLKEFKINVIDMYPSDSEIPIKYIACLETAIANVLEIYKIIRNTFIILDAEYRHIFRQIININQSLERNNS